MIKKFIPMLIAFGLFTIVLFVPPSWLHSFVTEKIVDQAAPALDMDVFKGTIVQERMWENEQFLPIYGSSELSRFDEFHPSRYFKNDTSEMIPFLIGRGGSQSLVHYLSLAAMPSEVLKNKRIVFVISPQWFQPEGIDEAHFAPNYGALQAYRFAFNDDIPQQQKQYIAKRLLNYEIVKEDELLREQLRIITGEATEMEKIEATLKKPFLYAYVAILEKKDIFRTLFFVKERKLENTTTSAMSFEQQKKRAEQLGRSLATNNDFYVADTVYDKKIKLDVHELKNYKQGASYYTSPEYEDLQQLFDLVKQHEIKALFVSIPVNGYWYDYIGFSKEERQRYYEKIRTHITDNGFDVADYARHEYDPYFLSDTIHIGWKGWVYMNHDIKKFYEKYGWDL